MTTDTITRPTQSETFSEWHSRQAAISHTREVAEVKRLTREINKALANSEHCLVRCLVRQLSDYAAMHGWGE